MMTPWSGSKGHYSAIATRYARFRPAYPVSLFRFLCCLCRERKLAWDVGAGSGQAATMLAEFFDRVIATDISREQMACAAYRPNLHYVRAPAEAAPLPDATLDLVVAGQALHWFAQERFWDEAGRVLKPAGVLAVWCYGLLSVEPAVDEVIRRLYSVLLGPYWREERQMVEAGYRGFEFPFPESPVPPLEMVERWDLEHLVGYLRTWSAVSSYREREGEDPVALVLSELETAWGSRAASRPIRWPMHVRVGICPKP